MRYIGNRSSGRMGIALANASLRRGWPTTLLLGPVTADPAPFPQEHVLRFRTAAELQALLRERWAEHDVLIMAAAVADWQPSKPLAGGKLRRDGALTLELAPTPDVLQGIAATARPDQLLIGFALEPADELDASAKRKLAQKQVDAIVANPLETMDAATIDARLYMRDGSVRSPAKRMHKTEFAAWLLDEVARMHAAKMVAAKRD